MLKSKIIFSKRYYKWRIGDWDREIDSGLAMLKTVSDSNARHAVTVIERLSQSDQKRLGVALVKRFVDPRVVEACGEVFSLEEKEMIAEFLRLAWLELENEMITSPPIEDRLNDPRPKLKRREMKKAVIAAMEPILGERSKEWDDSESCRYSTAVGPWQVVTWFDFGGRTRQLSCNHSIPSPGTSIGLGDRISLLSWLGISGATEWRGLYADDVEPTARVVAGMVKHFMDAVPHMLEGLSPDD
jgi:hypothetical protein